MPRLISILFGGALATIVLGSVGALAFINWAEWPVDQPIQFNHQVHVKKHGIECMQCHVGAKSAARATIPNIENCGQICHRPDLPALTTNSEEEKLRRYLAEGKKIPWQKVYWVDDHVFYSHARHTVLAKLKCETCHGNVGEMTTPVRIQTVPITMARCMDCHEQRGVTNDCNMCHR